MLAGELILYVTDNMNVQAWLKTRRPRSKLARHLLRLVGRLEALHDFAVDRFYIRTYHSERADPGSPAEGAPGARGESTNGRCLFRGPRF